MSRAVIAFDRLATLLLGLLLIVGGLAGIAWWRGDLGLSGPLNVDAVAKQTEQPWWPWVTGLVGAALVLLGLRWLAAHVITRGVGQVRLPGTGKAGRLTAQVNPVADAAATVLEGTEGVRSCRGTIQRDRGQLVARLRATIEPQADLREVAAAADGVATDLKKVLGRDDLHCLVTVHVARRPRNLARVT
ncbi:alkaline shock response membrane anchor protein AmaP [Phycicoccus jejuensis]|uniref:hypothetical protein n=1 Tax=Phycicoccus jejuensis TaxID=367299 RepID=UPI00384DF943